jgi:hypothetical protein
MGTGTRPDESLSPAGRARTWLSRMATILVDHRPVFELQISFDSTTDRGRRAPLIGAGRSARQVLTQRRTTCLNAPRLDETPDPTPAEQG